MQCPIENITIPKSINHIGSECFAWCGGLSKVTCEWEKIDTISASDDAFHDIFPDAKLYVPAGTSDIYKAKTPWSNFKYIIENTSSNVISAKLHGIMVQKNNGLIVVTGLSDNESVSLYNISGMQLGTTQAVSGVATFNISQTGHVAIVKIGNESIKIEL